MPKKYQLHHFIFELRDGKSLRFHAEQDDYFATLATILALLKDKLPLKEKSHRDLLKRIVKDLLFLQKQYCLTKKPLP